jgi:hypothetical protein
MALQSTNSKRLVLGISALCLAAACTGTPTPHPPDFLPTPKGPLISAGVMTTAGPDSVEVPIAGEPGAVQGDTDVWVVNLDDAEVAPKRVRSDAQGRFLVSIVATAGDRLRLVSRTASQHSRPFDLEAVALGEQLGVRPLMDTALDCLKVTPADELSLIDDGDFVLHNDCTAALTVSSARLRFGDQGFALGTLAQTVEVGAELRVRITYAGDEPDERADILLLDVQSGTSAGRYALGLWSAP